MFDQVLEMVKEHFGNNPQIASSIPQGKEDEVHQEIAKHVTNGLNAQAGNSGLLSQLENGITSGSPLVNAIEGGLVSSLASKFGLPPMATGAIAASLPGLIQKFAHKSTQNQGNDSSSNPLSNIGGGFGNMFNK